MFTFNLKETTKVMSVEEMARWCCLLEAVDVIEQTCELYNKNMDTVDWVKPLAIQKYIDERYNAMLHDVKVEHAMGVI